ncbi:MAG TPA: excinuclease ABC subunit UvrA, partial [Nitrospiraceae bacterium]|nr:excinuclease ABC subunit UvrA [Nitrospiraceae bacterium]
MSERDLLIEGAKQNNLQNITLKLPHNKVIVVTGVSGSGKSSLAFDTIFAEGQWRFIESISSYARLFLEKLDRPDVDAIHNIRPAVALEQKNPVRGSRSTVGTLTEIYDFLRLLYAKVSTPHCPQCGKEIRKWDTSQVVSELIDRHSGEKALIVFGTQESIPELKKRGFQRLWLHGEIADLNSEPRLPDSKLHIILDRLIIREDPRLSDSVEMAW